MARVRTLVDMIADVRERADMVNSTFISDATITEFLNQSLAKVWLRLVQNEAQPHYRSIQSYTVDSSSSVQALPVDFLRVQAVEVLMNGQNANILPFMNAEHGQLLDVRTIGQPRYRIQADNIEFAPVTQAFTATLYYTPCQVRLTELTDTFNGYNGYEEAAIYDAAAKCQAKEESNNAFNIQQRDEWFALIDAEASKRDAANPERVQDVQNLEDRIFWP